MQDPEPGAGSLLGESMNGLDARLWREPGGERAMAGLLEGVRVSTAHRGPRPELQEPGVPG